MRACDKTVTEIALSVGFESASYFAEIFHKHFGITPTDYRKRTDKTTDGPKKEQEKVLLVCAIHKVY